MSTIWDEDAETRCVWITMLAIRDWNGYVEGTVTGLAKLSRVTTVQCEGALKKFMSPDHYSRTKDSEGRRIEEVEGGWRILNHFKYQDEKVAQRREYNRVKQREYRAKGKRMKVGLGGVVSVAEREFVKDEEGKEGGEL